MDSQKIARPVSDSIASSVLSDPPSDIDEQESPFSPSPQQIRKPTISHIIAHAVIRRRYDSPLIGDETPQQTWQRRYGNAPPQPPQDAKTAEQAFYREMLNRIEDKARKTTANFEKQLEEKSKEIRDLERRVSDLEARNEELYRTCEKFTGAGDIVSNENLDKRLKIKVSGIKMMRELSPSKHRDLDLGGFMG